MGADNGALLGANRAAYGMNSRCTCCQPSAQIWCRPGEAPAQIHVFEVEEIALIEAVNRHEHVAINGKDGPRDPSISQLPCSRVTDKGRFVSPSPGAKQRREKSPGTAPPSGESSDSPGRERQHERPRIAAHH
jgi:hypothetical protein